MSQAISGMGMYKPYRGTKRKYTPSMAADIIKRAVKRAKTTPLYRSKFRLNRNNNVAVFPKHMRQTVTYSESTIQPLSATVGTVTNYLIRANSLFDPRFNVGGHQPYGFDQLMAIYTKFVVVGAKVTVHLGPAGASTFLYGVFGINIVDPAASSITQSSDAIESQYSTYNAWNASVINKVSMGFDAQKYFDVKDLQDADELIGTASADCTRQAYFNLWVASDTGASSQNVTFTYKVEYDAIFFEPRNVASS